MDLTPEKLKLRSQIFGALKNIRRPAWVIGLKVIITEWSTPPPKEGRFVTFTHTEAHINETINIFSTYS